MSKEWPLWEVFTRPKSGLDHKHCGSLHAPDAAMALQMAREVYTRRQEGCSIWVVLSNQIVASDPGEKGMYFDPADVTIHDTWYSHGLKGTGSHDFSVDGARVPVGRSVQPLKGTRQVDCALAAFPNFSLLAAGVAAVSLGIARHALDEFVDLAQGKRPLFSSRTLSQSGMAQAELAKVAANGFSFAFMRS